MKLNNIDLNKLKTFHSVVKTGSYAKSSEELNITKSAISQSLSTLESQIGLPLFLRKSKKMIPTQAALELFNQVDQYQSSLLKTLQQLQEEDQKLEGLLRIGSYLEFAKKQLTPALKFFLQENPSVKVQLYFDSPSNLQSLLEADKIDMSFSIYPVKNVKNIESQKLFREELILIAPKHWAHHCQDLENLLELPMIDYFPKHQVMEKWIYKHFKKRMKKLPIQVYAATAEMLLEGVSNGIGIGVLPRYLVDTNNTSIKICQPSDNTMVDHIWLNQFKDQFSSPTHKSFHLYLMKWFKGL